MRTKTQKMVFCLAKIGIEYFNEADDASNEHYRNSYTQTHRYLFFLPTDIIIHNESKRKRFCFLLLVLQYYLNLQLLLLLQKGGCEAAL